MDNGGRAVRLTGRRDQERVKTVLQRSTPDNRREESLRHSAATGPAVRRRASMKEDRVGVDRRDARGYSSLQLAAARGDVGAVRTLMRRGASPGLTCPDGKTALMAAAEKGHHEIVTLLAAGANLGQRDRQGNSALALAARHGHQRCIAGLLDRGAEIDSADGKKRTPLMLAAGRNHQRAVVLLCRRGAEIDRADARGWSASTHAARRGSTGVLAQLLKVAAEKDGGALAGRRGRLTRRLRYELVSHVFGAPRLHALSRDLDVALEYGQVRAAALLVRCGAQLAPLRTRSTLREAVRQGQASMMTVLLASLAGKPERRAIIEREFLRALDAGARPAAIDLLAQQLFAIDLEDEGAPVLVRSETLIPALAEHMLQQLGQGNRAAGPDARPAADWSTTIRWLCRERGVRHLVASALLDGVAPPAEMLRQVQAGSAMGPAAHSGLQLRLLCAGLLAHSRGLRRLRDDVRFTLDSYAEAPRAFQRLDWDNAGPLAAEARAQANALVMLGQAMAAQDCRKTVIQMQVHLLRRGRGDIAFVSALLCGEAGLLPALAWEIAGTWVTVRDAPTIGTGGARSTRATLQKFALQLLHVLRSSRVRNLLRAPDSAVVRTLLGAQAVHVAQFCGEVLARRH